MKPIVPASAAPGHGGALSPGAATTEACGAWTRDGYVAPGGCLCQQRPGGTGSPDGPAGWSNSSSVLSHQVLSLAVRISSLQMATGGLCETRWAK